MKIITAKEKFDYAIWHVLDTLERERLPYPNKKVIDYMMNIDIKYQAEFLFGLEHETIHFLKDKEVIEEAGEPDVCEIGKSGTPKYKVYEIYHFRILNKFNDYYRKYTNLLRGGVDITQLFGFRNKTFWLKLIDGSEATINFNPKKNRKHPTQPYYLLRAFIQAMKTGTWQLKGNWIETSLTRKQIIDEVKKLHYNKIDELDPTWITNVRNNLVNKSVPENLQKLMKVSPYESKSKTYTFSLKISS